MVTSRYNDLSHADDPVQPPDPLESGPALRFRIVLVGGGVDARHGGRGEAGGLRLRGFHAGHHPVRLKVGPIRPPPRLPDPTSPALMAERTRTMAIGSVPQRSSSSPIAG